MPFERFDSTYKKRKRNQNTVAPPVGVDSKTHAHSNQPTHDNLHQSIRCWTCSKNICNETKQSEYVVSEMTAVQTNNVTIALHISEV